MQSKPQQEKMAEEGRDLNFGDHSKQAERDRVLRETGGRQTATPTTAVVPPEAAKTEQDSASVDE